MPRCCFFNERNDSMILVLDVASSWNSTFRLGIAAGLCVMLCRDASLPCSQLTSLVSNNRTSTAAFLLPFRQFSVASPPTACPFLKPSLHCLSLAAPTQQKLDIGLPRCTTTCLQLLDLLLHHLQCIALLIL
jgi:hypothetical protein